MLKTQELAPKLKAIQKKYSSRDRESMVKMQEETSKLYKEAGVNPWASMLPMIIQLPIMWALYQAIWRTPELRHGDISVAPIRTHRSLLHFANSGGPIYFLKFMVINGFNA